jgi:hypothetical protein
MSVATSVFVRRGQRDLVRGGRRQPQGEDHSNHRHNGTRPAGDGKGRAGGEDEGRTRMMNGKADEGRKQ